jgi:GT2 family glycosyltransferase
MKYSPSSISGLRTLLVVNRKVFANFVSLPREPIEVVMGSARNLLGLENEDQLRALPAMRSYRLLTNDIHAHVRLNPPDGTSDGSFKFWLNGLTDWTLVNSETLQLMFTQRDDLCRVEIDRPIMVQQGGPGLSFQTYLATHRAKASLMVQFVNMSSGETQAEAVPFELNYLGGRQLHGYQKVDIPVPNWKGQIEVKIAVEYNGYNDDGRGSEPFVYIANAQVVREHSAEKSALIPFFAHGTDIPGDGFWLSAALPALPASKNTIELCCGSRQLRFSIGENPNIQVDNSYPHTLSIESSTQRLLSLLIDGKSALQLALEPGNNYVRVPDTYLDGATHLISLRDSSGSVAYWEEFSLLPANLTPVDVMQRESAAPFPASLFPQTARRYTSLRALIETAGLDTNFDQITHALNTVEAGYSKVKLKPLSFPKIEKPDVSIVIPACNKVEVTYLALCSLLISPNKASFEVIVVDDASTDETGNLEGIISGITVLHNDEPLRFIRSCNIGAEQARGQYVVLLNNDVEVTAGWLDELIATFGRFDRVGLAGSKLLFPDGRLQDGGGIVWGSGNPWNYGRGQNPEDPRFCYARQVDYLSGAAMMVPKSIWQEVGGLSPYLEPMYFEDTDFAFKVRKAGYSTWFVPSSVIYHYEGMTSGTDLTLGFKRYQEVNRPKFKRRWVDAYSQHSRDGHQPDLEKDRGIAGRILFIDYTTPRPDQDAGSYAALQEIRLVQSLGYKVTFIATNMAHFGKYTEDFQKIGVEMVYAPFYMTIKDFLSQRAAEFDAFYITRFYVAREVLSQIRTLAPDAKVLFNNADLHFLREIRASRVSGDEKRMEEARQTRERELGVISEVDVVLSYNEAEHAVIEAYSEGKARVLRCPWVVDIPTHVVSLDGRSGLSFLGSFRHHPNAEAMEWFVQEIMPRLASRHPDLTLSIYGSGVTDEIKALASDNVKAVGFVSELAAAYDPHRIFVAPLLSGAGIKGKVLEALARGIPCVLSPVAAEGIGLRHGHDCFIARTPEDWIVAITHLQQDDALWKTMSNMARHFMADSYSFERGRAAMRLIFEAADMFLPEDT